MKGSKRKTFKIRDKFELPILTLKEDLSEI